MARRILVFAFAAASYLCFAAVVLWGVAFLGGLGPWKTVDAPTAGNNFIAALATDLALIALFGLQHSVMARQGFKDWLTRWLPAPAERSFYVLTSSVALGLVFAGWQTLPGTVWSLQPGWAHTVATALFWLGWAMVGAASFLIDHFDLFGLRQAWLFLRGRPCTPLPFRESWAYRKVRHPLMASFLVAFWATPHMGAGHAVFSLGMTAYILVGTLFEERDLARSFGPAYAAYRERVPMLLPRLFTRRGRP